MKEVEKRGGSYIPPSNKPLSFDAHGTKALAVSAACFSWYEPVLHLNYRHRVPMNQKKE